MIFLVLKNVLIGIHTFQYRESFWVTALILDMSTAHSFWDEVNWSDI